MRLVEANEQPPTITGSIGNSSLVEGQNRQLHDGAELSL